MNTTPFFVLGPPRSGTTMLRDILRTHVNLTCPEETFYYRWGHPYGTNDFKNPYLKNKTIRLHRELDGIDEAAFEELLESARDRKELIETHGNWVLERTGKTRWFDKTPQNVFGMFLLKAHFPDSLFVHIHRNPLNVVSSLLEGKQIKGHTLAGSVNYWVEPVLIINEFRKLYPQQLIDLSYEELTSNPKKVVANLLGRLGESEHEVGYDLASIRRERNRYLEVMSQEQVQYVLQTTDGLRQPYGYE